MFNFFKKRKTKSEAQMIAEIVVAETEKSILKFQKEIIKNMEEMQTQLKEIDTNIRYLEQKILIKEDHFNKQFGLLHYKLHEVPIKNKKYD